MIKIFCDICGADITNYRENRPEATVGRLTISIMYAVDNVWNSGHACLDCIKKAAAVATIKQKKVEP